MEAKHLENFLNNPRRLMLYFDLLVGPRVMIWTNLNLHVAVYEISNAVNYNTQKIFNICQICAPCPLPVTQPLSTNLNPSTQVCLIWN